jgi:hypothetical protein
MPAERTDPPPGPVIESRATQSDGREGVGMPSRMAGKKESLRPGAHADVSSAGQVYAWNSRH